MANWATTNLQKFSPPNLFLSNLWKFKIFLQINTLNSTFWYQASGNGVGCGYYGNTPGCYCLCRSKVVTPSVVLHSLRQSPSCRLSKPLHLERKETHVKTLLRNSYAVCVFQVSAFLQYYILAKVLKVAEPAYIARLYHSDVCHYISCCPMAKVLYMPKTKFNYRVFKKYKTYISL